MDRATAFEVVQRSTVSEVYSQIISDLEYAIENLPGENKVESGRATVDGAKALLAKVYFYKHDFGNAGVNAANNDIFSGMYNYKVSDLSLTQDKVMTFDIDYILMRFAEVMFIYAEAANENGHSDVAIDLLKQIRKRAGIEAGADGLYGLKVGSREEIRQAILDERHIELGFENASQFSTFFRKKTGVPPLQYRKEEQQVKKLK